MKREEEREEEETEAITNIGPKKDEKEKIPSREFVLGCQCQCRERIFAREFDI